MFKLALIYESDKRYIMDFEIAVKTLKLKEEDVKKLEVQVLKEIAKG